MSSPNCSPELIGASITRWHDLLEAVTTYDHQAHNLNSNEIEIMKF